MRTFRIYEWVDGDLTAYWSPEGQDDWRLAGRVKFEDRDKLKSYVAVSEHLELDPPATLEEGKTLWFEFAMPRRW